MNIAQIAQTRHTCKAFDPARKIPAAQLEELRSLLRNAPSSVNSQPWHFIIAGSEAGKASLAKAAHTHYAYNEAKIRNASQVVVLCARTDLDAGHLDAVLDREQADGRFATPEAKKTRGDTMGHYVALHREQRQDLPDWIEKQVYIALGTLLLGAAALEIDACAMEGIDTDALDAELGLPARGLRAVVMVALGYRSADDFNAKLKKSRLPAEAVISEI